MTLHRSPCDDARHIAQHPPARPDNTVFVVVVVVVAIFHLSVEGEVQPVANKNLWDAWGMLLHLLHPTVHPLKAPLVCDVIYQQDTLRSPAIAPDDCAKSTCT